MDAYVRFALSCVVLALSSLPLVGRRLLFRMFQEDQRHGFLGVDGDPGPDAVIAELIFKLRDQNGHQWSQPGWCDIFNDPREEESPAHRLVEIGYPAVPRLIEALSDGTFTRSVGYWRDFTFSHYVLRVGDCAAAILSRISGKDFYVPRSTSGAMWKDGEADSVKLAVLEWWKEIETKGEEESLVAGVAVGDRDSMGQARKLIKHYPDRALGALTAGLSRADDAWVRTDLVGLLADLPGDAPALLSFLQIEMEHGPFLSSRVAAARGLLGRGKPEALPALIEEFRLLPNGGLTQGTDELLRLLVRSGDPEAIAALRADWLERSVPLRYEVIGALADREVAAEGPTAGPVEDLLVAALDDDEPRSGLSSSRNGKSFANPRICDLAGHVLWVRLPERYDFDIEAPLLSRDLRIHDLRNAWRRSRGKPEIPAPTPLEPLPGEPAVRAVTIRSVAVHARSQPVPAGFLEVLKRERGKPFTPELLVSFLQGFLREPPAPGLRISAFRAGDGTGVRLTLSLLAEPDNMSRSSGGLSVHQHVRVGDRMLNSSSGGGSWTFYEEGDGFVDLAEDVAEALAAPPGESFEIRVELRGRK